MQVQSWSTPQKVEPHAYLREAIDLRELVGEDPWKQRQVARPITPRAKPIADGGLTFGEAVEVAHFQSPLTSHSFTIPGGKSGGRLC
jgi:hypothetical protein